MDKMLESILLTKSLEMNINQQRMMSDQWLEKRAMFDSYMESLTRWSTSYSLPPPISNMRGYQVWRIDKENVLLLLIRGQRGLQCPLPPQKKIDRQFNKIVVQSVNHKLLNMEKRAVFDKSHLDTNQYRPIVSSSLQNM